VEILNSIGLFELSEHKKKDFTYFRKNHKGRRNLLFVEGWIRKLI
jgi:hypothetical protein